MIADKALDVALELLERAKVFQDRKADRLQARADRKFRKAETLFDRYQGSGDQRALARSKRLQDAGRRYQARVDRLLAD